MIGQGLLEHVFGGALIPAPESDGRYAFAPSATEARAPTAALKPAAATAGGAEIGALVAGVRLVGGAGNDFLGGFENDDTIEGGAGNDTIVGRAGLDVLLGGQGNDILRAAGGDDTIRAGGGDDTLRGGGGDDILRGAGGNDSIVGGAGADRVFGGAGNDTLKGNGAADFLSGGGKNDQLIGNSKNDTLKGGGGNDTLDGGPDDDELSGDAGDDVLSASAGRDTLTGGPGADIYVVRLVGGEIDDEIDFVTDFDYPGGDRVGLTEALSGVAFSDVRDVVRATPTGGDTIIAVNRGDGFKSALVLLDVEFTTDQLASYGFTTPPLNSTAFQENPYGFANRSEATADPAISADGRIVAFVDKQRLDGDPLDPRPEDNEEQSTKDVFLRNIENGSFQRVSAADLDGDGVFQVMRTPSGFAAESNAPAISADGRFVAFSSTGVGSTADTNFSGDVYVRDMLLGTNPVLVSVDESGAAGGGVRISTDDNTTESFEVLDISDDGTKVAFITSARLLPSEDLNTQADVYVRDLSRGETTLVSRSENPLDDDFGRAGGTTTTEVSISGDGRYVAFLSSAALVVEDFDGDTDVYIRDTQTGALLLASGPETGSVTDFDLSASGDTLAFSTDGALDDDDLNEASDVYVVELDLARFRVADRFRVSETEEGRELIGGESYGAVLSRDGGRLAFISTADDLAPYQGEIDFQENNTDERLYFLDLDGGGLTTTPLRYIEDRSADNQDSGRTGVHYDLTDDGGAIYRRQVDAAPGGSRSVSDTFSFVDPVALDDDDHAATFDLNRFGTAIRAEIDGPNDVDVFSFRTSSQSGDVFAVSVEGAGAGAGTLADAQVRIYSSQVSPTNEIAFDQDSGVGRDAFVTFQTTNNTRYFIEVEGAGSSTGSYRLLIDEADIGSDRRTPVFLQEDAPISDSVRENQPDWFRFDGEGGETFVFTLDQGPFEFGVQKLAELQILSAEEEVLAESAFPGAEGLMFTPEEDGLYYVVVSTTDVSDSYTLSVDRLDELL